MLWLSPSSSLLSMDCVSSVVFIFCMVPLVVASAFSYSTYQAPFTSLVFVSDPASASSRPVSFVRVLYGSY